MATREGWINWMRFWQEHWRTDPRRSAGNTTGGRNMLSLYIGQFGARWVAIDTEDTIDERGAVPEAEIHDVTTCALCFRPVDAHDRECPTREEQP